MTEARANTRAVGSAPDSAADSAPVRNLQGALEMAAEEKGGMVSSTAEEQRDWARLGARRQLEQPMDLEPSEQPHAERRRAAAGDEPHKRRAVPVAAEDSEDEPHWLLKMGMPDEYYGGGMMDPGEIRVDRFGNRFGYLPGTGRVTERWLGLSEEERKDDWRHYMQQLGERGVPSYGGGPTADDARKALHRSGEVPMPGYLPYDPLLPKAPMPLAV